MAGSRRVGYFHKIFESCDLVFRRGLAGWLYEHGAKLDRAGGPAYIRSYASGAHLERWYVQEKLDRANNPAVMTTFADGQRVKTWYRKGKVVNSPAAKRSFLR